MMLERFCVITWIAKSIDFMNVLHTVAFARFVHDDDVQENFAAARSLPEQGPR